MQNTALNHLKCSFPATKDRRVVLNLFASSQATLQAQIAGFILDKNKDVKDRKISYKVFLRPLEKEPANNTSSNLNLQQIGGKSFPNESGEFPFGTKNDKTDASVLLVAGLELYSWFVGPDKLRQQMRILKSKDFGDKLKIIHLFVFADQFASPQHLAILKEECTFLMDFTKASNTSKFTVDCVNYQEAGNPSKEKIGGSLKSGVITFEKYVPQNYVIEKKNPDQLIKTTFRLGLSEEQKVQKEKQILPFYKQKQIEEMKKKETDDVDEQYDLGIDDEQDECDDFDV